MRHGSAISQNHTAQAQQPYSHNYMAAIFYGNTPKKYISNSYTPLLDISRKGVYHKSIELKTKVYGTLNWNA